MRRRLAIAATTILVGACYSGVNGGAGEAASSEGGGGSSEAATVADSGSGSEGGEELGCVGPPRRVGLLTNRRYGHAVRDLLGLATAPAPGNGGGTHAGLLPPGPGHVDGPLVFEYHDIAQTAADEALAAIDVLAPCAEGTDERECAAAFVDDF